MANTSASLPDVAHDRDAAWRPTLYHGLWAAALAAFLVLWLYGKPIAGWAFKYPRSEQIPLRRWIGDFMKWLVEDASFGLFSFTDLTRFIAAVIEFPYKIVLSLLSTGFLQGQGSDAVQVLPPVSWIHVLSSVISWAVSGLFAFAGGIRSSCPASSVTRWISRL